MSDKKKKKEKKPWLRFRHRIVRNIVFFLLRPYTVIKYGITIEPFREQEKRPYFILMNHQTPFDQFFVGMSFKRPVYYVATEDIFSNGFVSSLIKWLVAPIPIQKKKNDLSAVIKCIRIAKEGGTIAIAPEGNRTYSGKTEYMRPAIAALARKMQLPIVLYRIEGGYGVYPRWSDKTRKGKMRSYVYRVIMPEEYEKMTDEELFSVIREGLYVNEAQADALFKSERRAEYLERAMYVCPYCGLSSFYSKGNETECLSCHRKITYGEDKTLTGVGFDFPYRFVNEWYDYQNEFINKIDPLKHLEDPLYTDTVMLSEVIVYKNKKLLRKSTTLRLYGDRMTLGEEGSHDGDELLELRFDDVYSASVMGRNKLNIYHKDKIYQLRGDVHFNAVKYVNFCYRYKNVIKGDEDGQFLGL